MKSAALLRLCATQPTVTVIFAYILLSVSAETLGFATLFSAYSFILNFYTRVLFTLLANYLFLTGSFVTSFARKCKRSQLYYVHGEVARVRLCRLVALPQHWLSVSWLCVHAPTS